MPAWKAFLLLTLAFSAGGSVRIKSSRTTGSETLSTRSLANTYPQQWFQQPLDHFTNTGHTFNQRFWYSDKHYAPGGPIFILDGGETSGTNRLEFLNTGIINILANATKGFGIVLEHRYYGQSLPVQNFTTDSMRWLNNAQALADSANFIKNYRLNGTPLVEAGPVIYYGGSYAGARSAHMRVLYPDLVFGAIASSGVVHAKYAMWEYEDVIRRAAPQACIKRIETAVESVDKFLAMPSLNNATKALFGLEIFEDNDFAQILKYPLESWQGLVWKSDDNSNSFYDFCDAIVENPGKKIEFHGHKVDYGLQNYAEWIRKNLVDGCPGSLQQCFLTNDTDSSLNATYRPWLYQTCTQWGYYTAAPFLPNYPRIVSKLVTAAAEHDECFKAFPPGSFNKIPTYPDVSAVNDLGSFHIRADRLAIIDGEVDPWRPMCATSQYYAHPRKDTLTQPFKLIPGAVHHWDEYGLADLSQEPPEIQAIHKQEIEFVKYWIKDWKPLHRNNDTLTNKRNI